ncbi:F-box protein skip23 [Rhynchospora pubera]|nr:F-box protein skip23 [Rhynchospora pubera]
MGPDWSLLPPELLEIIAGKVTSLGDYIRFRAVCHPWRSASSPRPRHLPVQLPWLLLPYRFDSVDDSIRLFYDLSASKIHKLDLPETRGATICGSYHGWLILHNGQVTSLFNPITRDTVSLPPYTAPPSNLGIAPFDYDMDDFELWHDTNSAMSPADTFFVKKAILTSSPLDASCMVFVHLDLCWELAFCKIGDERWTVIEFALSWGVDMRVDFSYSKGFLYNVDRLGQVTKYNLINPSKMLFVGIVSNNDKYLVQGVDGDVLVIYNSGRTSDDEVVEREIQYKVYKLGNDGKPEWIEVTDVGQNVLFLGGGGHALSLSSSNLQLPDWGAKCLCYDSKKLEYWNKQLGYWDSWFKTNIELGRLDDGTVTDISGNLGLFQMNRHWQKSLWLTPSLL